MNKISDLNLDIKKALKIQGFLISKLLVVLRRIAKCDSKEEGYKCQSEY